ncbi:hypothetical protein [Shouchella patagoniensis]|uniref:hypothetical protein n=1 Tax=Shouchella patagoniensis TaxID=228576 RepID=UPI001473D8E0|nr:hypothetical protein [Shouchella patagoniensis]
MTKNQPRKRRVGSALLLGLCLGVIFGMMTNQLAVYIVIGTLLGALVDWNKSKARK